MRDDIRIMVGSKLPFSFFNTLLPMIDNHYQTIPSIIINDILLYCSP